MAVADKLETALTSVDWNGNVLAFVKDKRPAEELASANMKLAVWSRQFEIADRNNPSLCFIREMQVAGQHVTALIALALYKAAAGSMRAVFETALYYIYFRTHLSELATLARDSRFFLEKKELLEYHKQHTPNFVEVQRALGLNSRLEAWYSKVSSIIHGQIPGTWVEHKSLGEIKPIKATQDISISTFVEGVEIVHRLFLCTVGGELWDRFSSDSKKQLLHGMSGDEKAVLRLDLG